MKKQLITIFYIFFIGLMINACKTNIGPSNNNVEKQNPLNLGDRVGIYKGSSEGQSVIMTLTMESNKASLEDSSDGRLFTNNNISPSDSTTNIIFIPNDKSKIHIEFKQESIDEAIYKLIINRNGKVSDEFILKRQ